MNKLFLLPLALISFSVEAQQISELNPAEFDCSFAATKITESATSEEHLGAPTKQQEARLNLRCSERQNEESAKIAKPAPDFSLEMRSGLSAVLQTGAYAGLISPGISFRFFKRNELILLGGFVPKKIDGERLWEANFKYQIEPFNNIHVRLRNGEAIAINPIHLGAGIVYGIHKNLFFNQPAQYPGEYYMPTAVRFTFNVGTSVSYRRVTLYVDYSALDTGAESYFWNKNGKFFRDNYGFFGLAGIGTLGFGAKFNLVKSRSRPGLEMKR